MTDEITTAQLLSELNELREEKGMKPLKTWKSTRAKLELEIDKLDNDGSPPPAEDKKKPTKPAKGKKKKKTADDGDKPKGKRGPRPKDDGLLSIGDIAASMKIDPKVARAKLRRYGLAAVDGRWPRYKPNSKEHKEILEQLKSNARKATDDAE